jgi:hypothetical protein
VAVVVGGFRIGPGIGEAAGAKLRDVNGIGSGGLSILERQADVQLLDASAEEGLEGVSVEAGLLPDGGVGLRGHPYWQLIWRNLTGQTLAIGSDDVDDEAAHGRDRGGQWSNSGTDLGVVVRQSRRDGEDKQCGGYTGSKSHNKCRDGFVGVGGGWSLPGRVGRRNDQDDGLRAGGVEERELPVWLRPDEDAGGYGTGEGSKWHRVGREKAVLEIVIKKITSGLADPDGEAVRCELDPGRLCESVRGGDKGFDCKA